MLELFFIPTFLGDAGDTLLSFLFDSYARFAAGDFTPSSSARIGLDLRLFPKTCYYSLWLDSGDI